MSPFAIYAYAGEDQELTFRTYRGYLEAVRMSIASLCPSTAGFLEGVASAVHAAGWTASAPRGGTLAARAGEYLRNAWGTEVLLNAPRVIGGPHFITFANHWAVVQAYYAVFGGFNALLQTSTQSPPRTHTSLLRWASSEAGRPTSPFVAPWTWQVGGPVGAYSYPGFPAGFAPQAGLSNIAAVMPSTAPDVVAKALKTTRDRQVTERKAGWLKGKVTARGTRRQRLTGAELNSYSGAMGPTTLFDLLYRLRLRSNYEEADALLTGALTFSDAEAFHHALCDIVAATLLTIEIYIAHRVGGSALESALRPLTVPPTVGPYSAVARQALW